MTMMKKILGAKDRTREAESVRALEADPALDRHENTVEKDIEVIGLEAREGRGHCRLTNGESEP